MTQALHATLKELEQARARTDTVLVSYSGGKDSIAVLDLASRQFARVECFFMYLVPGLEVTETMLEWARQKYGVKIHQYLHWGFSRAIKQAVYCDAYMTYDTIPDVKLTDIYRMVRHDTGIEVILTGAKRADGIWRRRNMVTEGVHMTNVVNPLEHWTKMDVLAYITSQGLPVPSSQKGNAGGVGLGKTSLLWLYDNHPKDFERLEEVFPYIRAVVKQREFFGEAAVRIG